MTVSEHLNETYRSMISISLEGFKALQFLNGGALVAIGGYATTKDVTFVARQASAIILFGLGLFLGTLCYAGSYLTQYALYNEVLKRPGLWGVRHQVWVVATLALSLVAAVLFAIGVATASCALRSN
jgi:hypothetical protein